VQVKLVDPGIGVRGNVEVDIVETHEGGDQ